MEIRAGIARFTPGSGVINLKIEDQNKNTKIKIPATIEKVITDSKDESKEIELKGELVHLNVFNDKNKQAYRVSIKIKDFIENESFLKAHLRFDGRSNSHLPNIYPKQLQEYIKTAGNNSFSVINLDTLININDLKDSATLTKEEIELILDTCKTRKDYINTRTQPSSIDFENEFHTGTLVIIPHGKRKGVYLNNIEKAVSKSNQTKEQIPSPPRTSQLKDFPGLSTDELNRIRSFCNDHSNRFNKLTSPVFISRNEHKIPRSLVVFPSGPRKGIYVLLKQHNTEHLGLGSSNRVALAVNLETGEHKGWRSGDYKYIHDHEIYANEEVSKYPEHFDFFDNYLKYENNIRDDINDRRKKTGEQTKVVKMGSIIDIAKGGDLDQYLKKNQPPFKDRLRICAAICQHLSVLHEDLNLVHRDLKKDNIMMSEDGYPKIADFGNTLKINELTKMKSAFQYSAPEFYRNERKGVKTIVAPSGDVWALGVLLLEILGDNNAWDANFPQKELEDGTFNRALLEEIKDIVYENVTDILSQEGCSEKTIEEILDIINDDCLRLSPENRVSAKEVGERLTKLLNSLSQPAASSAAKQRSS